MNVNLLEKVVSLARLFLVAFLLLAAAQARPLVIAHRGGSHLGPENRLETFKKALDLGVDGVELDIHLSADGHIMVTHDLTLKRCFDVEGKVNEMSREELQKIGVPTLEDVIDLVDGRCLLFIEIKQPKDGTRHQGLEERLIELLQERQLGDSVVIISFYRDSVEKVEQQAPHLETGLLLSRKLGNLSEHRKELGTDYVGPRYTLVSSEVVVEAHELGLKVSPWTVNGERDLARFLKLDLDAITTDDPDILLRLIGK